MASNAPQFQQEHSHRESSLNFLATLSFPTDELTRYLHTIASEMSQALGSNRSIITVYHNGSGRIVASDATLHDQTGVPIHHSLAQEVFKTGQLLTIEDMQSDVRASECPAGYLSYLGVPLRSIYGDCMGALCSLFHQPQTFSREAIQLAETLALKAETAINNYQFYHQQQRIIQCLEAEIGDRKQVEAVLRHSEARFRTLVEHAADVFLLIAPDDGQIVDANRRACEALDYTYEELLTLSIADIDAKPNLNKPPNFQQQAVPNGRTILESVYRRKDGTTFPVEISVRRFEAGDRLLELALARDISDRKQTERAVTHLAEIGELAAMVVHEIRNPLTSILIGLTGLQGVELPERMQRRLDFALEEAERLKRLLNEILICAKHQVMRPSKLEINQMAITLLESIRDTSIANRHTIEFSSSLPMAWVWGDRDKLKQVFINLIRNACEAISEHETIIWRIEPGPIANWVSIHIHNGGEPIAPDILTRLGTPFFTTKSSGNGMGLAIVRKIIDAHQGKFLLESTVEKGTIATVQLPLVHVEQTTESKSS